jgi:hypothetical protein
VNARHPLNENIVQDIVLQSFQCCNRIVFAISVLFFPRILFNESNTEYKLFRIVIREDALNLVFVRLEQANVDIQH